VIIDDLSISRFSRKFVCNLGMHACKGKNEKRDRPINRESERKRVKEIEIDRERERERERESKCVGKIG